MASESNVVLFDENGKPYTITKLKAQTATPLTLVANANGSGIVLRGA